MKLLIGIFLFLPHSGLIAQTIKGKITDERNEPIPGAYVFFHKTENHAHSNLFGSFTLDGVSKGDTLVISHVGFEGRSIIVQSLMDELVIELKEQVIELSGVTIRPQLDAINLFTKLDLNTAPVNSSQEVLRKVPGLIIGQHAGGGKAEQIFLRGFDIDHGTDINITVDGLPVNMVSHAHGQGYADLHFLIPETIEKIDFGKGPYYTDQGNFTTAGYVAFKTKDRLPESKVQFQYGRFNTFRTLGMFNLLSTKQQSAYIAADYQLSDGPFESPQNFNRINLVGKYKVSLANDNKVSVLLSRFTSRWDASGQIPERLVRNGTISRFGFVDNTEGGETSRTNIKVGYLDKIDEDTHVQSSVFFSNYDFELYSNFTFFLNDPVNGDQIRQKENRQIFGASSEWNKSLHDGKHDIMLTAGLGFRNDRVSDNELSSTSGRRNTLQIHQLGDVDETNIYGYTNAELEFGNWILNPGLRFDYFKFNYVDETVPTYQTQVANKGFLSPKLNLLYNHTENIQFYLKSGIGFHSNDSRVSTSRNGRDILPAAYGGDFGAIWKPAPKLLINTALWALFLDQEFVYVGDAGIVEPSGKTRRTGIDLGLRYQLSKSIFLYTDVNMAHARSRESEQNNDRIPLAPEFTATGGIDIVDLHGFSGGIRYRHLRDRPANEDNSIVAYGYTITDLNVNYDLNDITIGVAIENLFNHDWNEAQFATESRLTNEPESVEEIHFTPGTPFLIRGSISYKF